MEVQSLLHLLPWTHQDYIRFRAKLSALNVFKLLQSLFVLSLQVFPGYRHWPNVNFDLHEAPHEKFDVGQIWRSRSSRIDYPRPNHRSGNVDTCLWTRGDAKSRWKSVFHFPSSGLGIKRNSNFSFPLKKKRPHCLSEFRPPPQKNMSSACSLRVSPALGFSTSPKNEIFLHPWNTFVPGMLAVAESWTIPTSAQRYALSYSVVCSNTYSWKQVDFRLPTHCCGIFKSRLRDKSTSFDLAGKPAKKELLFSHFYFVCPSFSFTDASCGHKRFITLSGRIRGWRILFERFFKFSLIVCDRLHLLNLKNTELH